jgi:hypothetical protein
MIAMVCLFGYIATGLFTGIVLYIYADFGDDPPLAVSGGFFWPLIPLILAAVKLCSWAERMRVRRKKMLAERAALRAAIEYEVTKLP